MRRVLVAAVLVLVLVTAGFLAFGRRESGGTEAPPPPPAVTYQIVLRGEFGPDDIPEPPCGRPPFKACPRDAYEATR